MRCRHTHLIAILSILGGCVRFNNSERQLLNTYYVGQTLEFKSVNTGAIKDFKILSVTDLPAGFSESHLTPARVGEISYTDLNDTMKRWYILEMVKDADSNSITFLFEGCSTDLKNNLGTLNVRDSIVIEGKKYTSFYEINRTDSFGRDFREYYVTKVYWQKDIGIIKYDLDNGDSYVRVNIK